MTQPTRLALVAIAAFGLAALTPAHATTAAAKAPAAKTAAKAPTKSTAAKAGAGAAAATTAALSGDQLAVAGRVHTGAADCEFDQQVHVKKVDGQDGWFHVGHKGKTYTMAPESTTTGAVRLEDKKNGVMWLQIANKSMLMNSKAGQRMVDNCTHPAQRS